MKQNLEDFEKALVFIAVWNGYAQTVETNPENSLIDILTALTGWDVLRTKDAIEQCIAKGLIEYVN